jgi:hypothetical protein
MKYSTVEEVLASFPHPIIPSVEGDPDYQTIHDTRKFLQANSRSIDTNLGGGTLGHLGLIASDAAYSNIAPPTAVEPTVWEIPNAPRAGASNNRWKDDPTQRRAPRLGRGCANLPDLNPRPSSIEEENYWPLRANVLGNLEWQHVGLCQHISKRHIGPLFETYGNITAVNLEINFEHMRRAWDPQKPVETLLKQIQDCADYLEAGGVPIGPLHQIKVGYAKIFATGKFMSACRRWNKKLATEKTWTHFKSHFAAAHCQHKQMQAETAAHAGFHAANAAMTQDEDHMDEATIGALANMATATAADRGVVSALAQANSRLVKQLEETTS